MILWQAFIGKAKDIILGILTPKDPYKEIAHNRLHAARYYGNEIERIYPVQNCSTVSLSNTLIQSPGYVEMDGQIYDLTQDGLYRFYRLRDISVQRLVCSNGHNSLLKILGYLWIYGRDDDLYPGILLEKELAKRVIFASCGALARQAHTICQALNIESRVVACITAKPWNGQDEGHTLLEIKNEDGQWFCYDPSFHFLFTFNDTPISLYEMSKKRELIEYKKLPGNGGHGQFKINGYDYGFWIEERLNSINLLKAWYQDKLEVPLISIGKNYSCPEGSVPISERQRFKFRYQILPDADFYNQYYPDQKDHDQ